MSVFETIVNVVCDWARITPDQIVNLQTELCVLLAIGRPGVACDTDVLAPLVANIKAAFPNKKLGGLRPSDLKSPGQIRTLDSLADFVARSGNRTLMRSRATGADETATESPSASKRTADGERPVGGRKAAKQPRKSAKKPAKKSAGKSAKKSAAKRGKKSSVSKSRKGRGK